MLISSRENPIIKEAAALASSAKARRESGQFLAEGERLCYDAAISGVDIRRVFYTAAAAEKWPAELGAIRRAAAESIEVTASVAEKLSETKTPQGVFALCTMPQQEFSADGDGLYVLLAELQDPGNLGSILRTCEAMGAAGVLVCSSADLWSPKVLRASMGSLFRLPTVSFPDVMEALAVLKAAGCVTYASALDLRAKRLPDVRFSSKSAVLIGNEGAGLSPEVTAACDETVMIPMPGRAESLNAAAAAAILIYQFTAQSASM